MFLRILCLKILSNVHIIEDIEVVMNENNEDNMIESFAKNIDKAKLAGQIQSYLKGGKEGMFKEKKSEFEYKKDIIKMLLERKRNGL